MSELNYIEINRRTWNQKTAVHYESDFYNVKEFILGGNSLNSIELDLLGDLNGKKILHLQCHFGQDSISLVRLGAQVTGVDLSDKAIEKAHQLAKECGVDAKFICCDIYDLEKYLDEKFDIVFTSYGTIGWLPDIHKWAKIVSHYLKPNGIFVFAEFHPVVWMYDDDFTEVRYSYFIDAPIIEIENGTYADKEANLVEEFCCWNHGLAEVLQAIMNEGLRIDNFQEYDYSPYDCFNKTVQIAEKKFQLEPFENKIPIVYSLRATKV
jgi:2-polyprenyl-3-methyl-5-hydroxy-6-metoxy-1,4-benzoquinol methylase